MAAAIEAVRDEDIARLAARILAPRRCTVSVLGPRSAMDAPARFEAALFG